MTENNKKCIKTKAETCTEQQSVIDKAGNNRYNKNSQNII